MKECPNCHELIGDSVDICFNCHYNFKLRKVMNSDMIKQNREQKEAEHREYINNQQRLENIKNIQLTKNPLYEYDIIILNDLPDGTVDEVVLKNELIEHAAKGWRLHTIFSNDVGKNITNGSNQYLSIGSNATINQTVMIFERCIKPLET